MEKSICVIRKIHIVIEISPIYWVPYQRKPELPGASFTVGFIYRLILRFPLLSKDASVESAIAMTRSALPFSQYIWIVCCNRKIILKNHLNVEYYSLQHKVN